ncbi:MAG: hypothetical protein EBZ74_10290 [Planctomycetia bacterium]|nr:hypothetical protein [Planctomycetia bacterium]
MTREISSTSPGACCGTPRSICAVRCGPCARSRRRAVRFPSRSLRWFSILRGQRDRVQLRIEGEPFELPKFVAGNLLLVVQEAIRNARHHAEEARVDVVVRFHSAAHSVEVTVHDDGPGFEVATAAGPEQGHFGLQGMRERIANLGGRFKIVTAPGAGTTITASVAVGSHDSELDADAEVLRPTGAAGAL